MLYDFVDHHGLVNENVFAYSNRAGHERAVVIYNNKYDRASGWVRYSSASTQKGFTHSLRSGLALREDPDYFTLFRDIISGLEFIRNNQEIQDKGLFAVLDGFKYHVFMDFREVRDDEYHHYSHITAFLDGRGVPSVDEALKETFLAPVHNPFYNLFSEDKILLLTAERISAQKKTSLTSDFNLNINVLIRELQNYFNISGDFTNLAKEQDKLFNVLLKFKNPGQLFQKTEAKIRKNITSLIQSENQNILVYYLWIILNNLGSIQDKNYKAMLSLSWFDELLFSKIIKNVLLESGIPEPEANHTLNLLRALIIHSDWNAKYRQDPGPAVHALFEQPESNKFLQVNRYQDNLYFNKESFEQLIRAFSILAIFTGGFTKASTSQIEDLLKLLNKADACGYRVEEFVGSVSG